jgi:hypothetical protein
LRQIAPCTDTPAIGAHYADRPEKSEKYTGKLCKIGDTLTTVGYAQPGIACVIKLLWPIPVLGIALAQVLPASTPACPF